MARDSGSEFSGTFDNMLDENRQRLDNLLGRRATAAPDRQSKPATAERRTERQTERPTESRTGRKTGRKSGCGGGQNFSFEVDVGIDYGVDSNMEFQMTFVTLSSDFLIF